MNFWGSLPAMASCSLCGREDVIFDYDQQEYHLFRHGEQDLVAHAACLVRRFGVSFLVELKDFQVQDFFWMLKESNFGTGREAKLHGGLRRMMLRALIELQRTKAVAS